MSFDLALFDLVSPYVLLGDSFGQWHAALSVINVEEHSLAIDDAGIVIRGTARFKGEVTPFVDPSNMRFGIEAEHTEGHPANDPGRRDPWIDIRDARIDFQLSAPTTASQKVATAVTAIGGAPGFAQAAAVMAALDPIPGDLPPSDYPSTEFVLDMVLTTVNLRLPFLRPAQLLPNGQLVLDTTKNDVVISLPRLKVRLAQGSNLNDPLTATLLSAGASSLDATDDLASAELITMDPPYAFIGASRKVGFGFRSAILDLADLSTPPDVLAQFGFDETWTGLYFPEIRLFIAPHGADDFAVSAGARNLLIGLGVSSGITGDFELDVMDQGSGSVQIGARFYDATNRSFATTSVSPNAARVALPLRTRMIVDVDGGLTPYNVTATIDGTAAGTGRVFSIDLSTKAEITIVVNVTDAKATPNSAQLTITATRLQSSTGAPGIPGTLIPGTIPDAQLETTSVKQGGLPVGAPRFIRIGETPNSLTAALEGFPAPTARWTVGGIDRGTSDKVTFDLAPGTEVSIKAEVAGLPAQSEFTAYYRYDYPQPGPIEQTRAYAKIIDQPGGAVRSTNTASAVDEGLTADWPPGTDAGAGIRPLLNELQLKPGKTDIAIKGYASFETDTAEKRTYNTALALRRAIGLQAIIEDHPAASAKFNITASADMTRWNATDQGDPVRNLFWKAVASWPAQAMPGTVTEGTASRATPRGDSTPGTEPTLPDDPRAATPPQPPNWFKQLGAKVRIVRNQFVACEIHAKLDIETPTEKLLRDGGVSDANMPAMRRLGSNPSDGIIDLRLLIQIDDATDTVIMTGSFGADPTDRDGLMMTGWLPNEPVAARHVGRDFLGSALLFMPLLSATSSLVTEHGALAEMAVTSATLAVPLTLAGLKVLKIERVIWYGGEFSMRTGPKGDQLAILLDIEVATSLSLLDLITIPETSPLRVRYKAVGLLVGHPNNEPRFQLRPVFDASRGYTVDVSGPGVIRVAPPLDQILKILGARIARNNPLLFEIDLGFAIDLGVVSIERARVRMRVDAPSPPELTAFVAKMDIPGAIRGRGYMEMNDRIEGGVKIKEIKGQIDVTLIPVNLRIAAGVGVAHIDPDQTGVIVTIDVEFPVAIPLANSGLGIYGFLGLFAMNYARDESKATPVTGMAPALAWLRATGGDPTRIDFWKPNINSWAFGVGALLGTMGSSIIFNLKGVLLLELPGPRLLLMMKANLLIPMPERKGNAEGMFFTVIDLDFGRGTLTIGLSVDFDIDPLLKLTIPTEAFFNFDETSKWHLYLGQYINQVQAKVLHIFEATGYLMISGNGLPADGGPPIGNLPAVTGFSLATGLHVSFTWGGGPLYAQVAAGFDAIIGFDPFRMAGILTVRGTLHLFILDISAWADLNVDIGEKIEAGVRKKISQIKGDICGKVEFLFFDIEGCVHFELGDDVTLPPPSPSLLEGVKFVSRSPALVMGSGVDKGIDSTLADAVRGDTEPANLPVVPIDAIPSLMMSQPPLSEAGLKFKGQAIESTPEPPIDGWVQHGDTWIKFTLKTVELIGPALTAGKTPATWWKAKSGKTALKAQLALLSWVPDATPKAFGSSKFLDESVKEHWGTICDPAARPAPVLWTFVNEIIGPSETGWGLNGLALPDAPGSLRSTLPDLSLRVTERWRCGIGSIDNLRGIFPAVVEGSPVPCSTPGRPPVNHNEPRPVPDRVTNTLQFDNPIAAIRGTTDREAVPFQQLTLTDIVQRFATGQSVSRSVLSSALLPQGSNPNRPDVGRFKCFAKALASPVFDEGEMIAFGPEEFIPDIKQAWQSQNFRPGPLDDAIVLHTGEFEFARLFLYVPARFLQLQAVLVAASDDKDNFADQHIVGASDLIPATGFPPYWLDPASGWSNHVLLLNELVALKSPDYVGVFVEVRGGGNATLVQVGATPASRPMRQRISHRPFYIAAIEVLRQSEVERSDFDNSEQKKKQHTITSALGLDSADNALLAKNSTYQIKVSYEVEQEKRPPGGGEPTNKSKSPGSESFWFRTDDDPPPRIDPWLLARAPAEGELHVFAADPVKIVFGTNNLHLFYDAYGKKLQARLKPSSFKPVVPPAGLTHPLPLDATTIKAVKGGVFSPWEQAVRELAESALPCIPVEVDTFRHSILTIPIPLDLYTDYVLDIEMLDKSAADGTVGQRVYRHNFSTGAFFTLNEFGATFMTERVRHRGVAADDVGKLQAIGAKFVKPAVPQGSEFDQAWQDAGMEALPVPKSPRVTIFWEPGTALPQPVAILIDASEPMFRSRVIPEQVTDGGLAAAKRFEMVNKTWLELAEQAGGDAIVSSVIPAPGGQRALVLLAPGARSKHVKLALHRIVFPKAHLDGETAVDEFVTIVDSVLDHAPWEEVD